MMKVTLSEVAKRAGVSVATAAKVVSGNRGNIRVSEKTRALILQVAAELNYRPNYNAQRLAGRASRVIGILIEKNASEPLFRMLGEIEREAAVYGYRCMIGEFKKDVSLQREQYDIFMQHGVDGVICMPSDYLENTPEFCRVFSEVLRNTVFVDNPSLPGSAFIHVDRKAAAMKIVRHLHEQGAGRIMQVRGNVPYRTSIERRDGYLAAMSELGFSGEETFLIEIEPHFTGPEIFADAEMVVREHIIPKKIDGVAASNDLYATAILNRLHAAGLRVPDDVMVVGYNNSDYTTCTLPPLTSVDDNVGQQARAIVALLLKKLADVSVQGEAEKIIPDLVIRESTLKNGRRSI